MDHQAVAQLLGNYGEFVGAIAVVTTLAYLAVQIRQSALAERRTTLDSSIRNFVDIRQAAFENAEISEIAMKGYNDPDALSELEWFRFRLFMYNVMLSFWYIYSQPADLREDLWETQIPAVLRVIQSPGGRAYWEQHQGEFVSSFRDEIERLIGANPTLRTFS